MTEYFKFFLKHQKNKCVGKICEIIENDFKKKKIHRKNQKKLSLIKLSIPFWILENFMNSSVAITIIPKNTRKMGYSNFCFFSVLYVYKNLKFLEISNFLKTNLKTKFTKLLEITVQKDFNNFRKNTDASEKKNCVYEKIMLEIIFFSKKQTIKWKEGCLNC